MNKPKVIYKLYEDFGYVSSNENSNFCSAMFIFEDGTGLTIQSWVPKPFDFDIDDSEEVIRLVINSIAHKLGVELSSYLEKLTSDGHSPSDLGIYEIKDDSLIIKNESPYIEELGEVEFKVFEGVDSKEDIPEIFYGESEEESKIYFKRSITVVVFENEDLILLEGFMNDYFEEHKISHEGIKDIKFTSVFNGEKIIHSAMLILKADVGLNLTAK